MRAIPFLVALSIVGLSGCLEDPTPADPAAADAVAKTEVATPHDTKFTGKVPLTATESLGHSRPAEDVLWPVSQAGFLLNLSAPPQAFEVRLTQSGMAPNAQWMIMLHSHKAHGTNTYVEHITNWTTKAQDCLRVPGEDLAAGTWQVMVHTRDAANAAYELKATTWGVQGTIEPERHGHKREDGAFQVDKHRIEECTGRL